MAYRLELAFRGNRYSAYELLDMKLDSLFAFPRKLDQVLAKMPGEAPTSVAN
jgi:hypothetical protein